MAIFNLSGTNQGGGGVNSYEVTINLMTPSSPSSFQSCVVCQTENGVEVPIGSITSATGSITVTMDASANPLVLNLNGNYVAPPSGLYDVLLTEDTIGYSGYTEGGPAKMKFIISGDGWMDIHAIDWDD